MKTTKKKKVLRFTLCVGGSDKTSKKQVITADFARETVRSIVKGNKANYSVVFQKGGYIDSSGEYIFEDSLQIILVDITERKAHKIATEICKAFNQEEVFVIKEYVDVYYLKS